MSAFNFDLWNDSKCVSSNNTTCVYFEGRFCFDQGEITIGNSDENDNGGIGGFVGPEHKYFLYCGMKHAEIALAKLNADTDEWEDHGVLQWKHSYYHDDYGFFEKIWVAKEKPALIFEPRNEYKEYLLAHKKFKNVNETKAFIKLDLSTGHFTSITRKRFLEQRCFVLDENSEWPSPHENCLSGDTLAEDPTQAIVLRSLRGMMTAISACWDEISKTSHGEKTSLTAQVKPRRHGT
jgi:hypothetical protein